MPAAAPTAFAATAGSGSAGAAGEQKGKAQQATPKFESKSGSSALTVSAPGGPPAWQQLQQYDRQHPPIKLFAFRKDTNEMRLLQDNETVASAFLEALSTITVLDNSPYMLPTFINGASFACAF
jgi:hypothetical protein